MEGRRLDVTIALADKPGELTHVSDIIASTGANIISVRHTRSDIDMDINSCFLSLQMETRNKAHAEEVKQLLAQSGYQIVSK